MKYQKTDKSENCSPLLVYKRLIQTLITETKNIIPPQIALNRIDESITRGKNMYW